MPEDLEKGAPSPLAGLLVQADGLIGTALAESDRAVEALLDAIGDLHAAGEATGQREAVERVVVAMQFYDLLCQRLRLVQDHIGECRRLAESGTPATRRDGMDPLLEGVRRVRGASEGPRPHGGRGNVEFFS